MCARNWPFLNNFSEKYIDIRVYLLFYNVFVKLFSYFYVQTIMRLLRQLPFLDSIDYYFRNFTLGTFCLSVFFSFVFLSIRWASFEEPSFSRCLKLLFTRIFLWKFWIVLNFSTRFLQFLEDFFKFHGSYERMSQLLMFISSCI